MYIGSSKGLYVIKSGTVSVEECVGVSSGLFIIGQTEISVISSPLSSASSLFAEVELTGYVPRKGSLWLAFNF